MKMKKMNVSLMAIIASLIIAPTIVLAAEERGAPTVAGCVEKTGMSEAKCTEMMGKMKDMPQGEGGGKNLGGPMEGGKKGMSEKENFRGGSHPQNPDGMNINMNMGIDERIENAQKMKENKEKRFTRTEERIQKMINYLESKDIDVDELKEKLAEFKVKAGEISNAFDTYIQALKNYQSDGSDSNKEAIKSARENIRTLSGKLAAFYRTDIRESIKELISQLEDNE